MKAPSPTTPRRPDPRAQQQISGQIEAALHQAKSLLDQGKHQEAEKLCLAILARDPGNARALLLSGSLARAGGDIRLAASFFGAAAAREPKSASTQIVLAEALEEISNYELAARHFQLALMQKPNNTVALRGLGRCQVQIGNADQALPLFEKVIKLEPAHPTARIEYANALTSLGRMDHAAGQLRKTIEQGNGVAAAYLALAHTKRFSGEPPELDAILGLLGRDDLAPAQRSDLDRAAGKMLSDLGRDGEAIAHVASSKATARPFDLDAQRDWLARLRETFTRDTLAKLEGLGDPSEVPVFILGMPRSGTTLVEQICASHPDVYGAGERTDIWELAHGLSLSAKSPDTKERFLAAANSEALSKTAARYLSAVRALAPKARRITDKMPHNFELVGLIAVLFPNARIVHVRRDPIDGCLSCFFNVFNDAHGYNNDLRTLGLYYREYDRLMRHWNEVLPGRMLDCRYEDLIADQEGQSRRLIDHLGLPWDDACLRFHETDRAVNTPSRWQVRQPIYASSVKRWKAYEDKIEPLIEALGDLAAR